MTSQDAPLVDAEEDDDPLLTVQRAAMRVAGFLWLAGAVIIWGRLIGYLEADLVPLWYDPQGPWIITLVAAILAPVVSVGLWLASSWGGVIWSFAILLGWFVAVSVPEALPFGLIALIINTLALAAVGALAGFRAWRDRDPDD